MKSTILYSSYSNIPAYQQLEEQAQKLKEAYEIGINSLKSQLKVAETEFCAKRTEARLNAKFNYTMNKPTINEHGTHYHIVRTIIDPLLGDDDFNKTIEYGSFKIVNNVFISTGGGYQLQNVKTGDILTDADILLLNKDIVPELFKNKPKFVESGNYLGGS